MTNDQEKGQSKTDLLNKKEEPNLSYDRSFTGFLDKLYEVTRPTGHSRDDAEDSGTSVCDSES
jgi:hypothetical protein